MSPFETYLRHISETNIEPVGLGSSRVSIAKTRLEQFEGHWPFEMAQRNSNPVDPRQDGGGAVGDSRLRAIISPFIGAVNIILITTSVLFFFKCFAHRGTFRFSLKFLLVCNRKLLRWRRLKQAL